MDYLYFDTHMTLYNQFGSPYMYKNKQYLTVNESDVQSKKYIHVHVPVNIIFEFISKWVNK